MPKVTLICPVDGCGNMARRELTYEAGSRGIHETSSEPATCPVPGHGSMIREDGRRNLGGGRNPDSAAFKRSKP